jgi:cyclohexa-1,5-dienecarbonyl-CoA hydratase
MAYETIDVQSRFDGQVVEIALGPPPANIVTRQMMRELAVELPKYGKSETAGVKALVFTGQGDHFSYGASVEEHTNEHIKDMLPRFHELVGAMLECPVPTIAKVRGRCLGGGFEVMLGCGMVVADTGAKFAVPEIKLAVFPPVASLLLPFITNQSAASEIVLSGEEFSAADMHRMGVVGRVADGDLDGAVDEYIERSILPKSASSLRFTNRVAMRSIAAHYRAHIRAVERLYIDDLMATRDANEGIASFLEKRKPKWSNA